MPHSQRSHSLARALQYDLLLLGRSGYRRPWTAPFVYPILALRSAAYLLHRRPEVVIVIAPPFILPLLAITLGAVLGYKTAIDVHSGAIMDRRWRWSLPILRWLCRRATCAVVTVPTLCHRLGNRVSTVVLLDPLLSLPAEGRHTPTPSNHTDLLGGGRHRVVAICGWGDDEPIEQIVEAAQGADWDLLITGRPRRIVSCPPNVRLTGFLAQSSYLQLVAGADAVVVLTTRPNTVLSGLWEAIALGRPLVTSATDTLKHTIGQGPTYVEARSASIRTGVDATLQRLDDAHRESVYLRDRLRQRTDAQLERLHTMLSSLDDSQRHTVG